MKVLTQYSLKHLQDKVRDMFGPRTPSEPHYDPQLRPRDAKQMDYRVAAFTYCKEKWHYLASCGSTIGQQGRQNFNTVFTEPLRVSEPMRCFAPAANFNLYDYHWAWGIANRSHLDIRGTPPPNHQPVSPNLETSSPASILPRTEENFPHQLPVVSSYSPHSSNSSLVLDNISIGSSSQATYSSSGSQSSLKIPAIIKFPRRMPKISAIKRYLRYRRGDLDRSVLSTLSLEEASNTIKEHGFGFPLGEENLYRICFGLSCFASSLPPDFTGFDNLKSRIRRQNLERYEFRRQAAHRLAEAESKTHILNWHAEVSLDNMVMIDIQELWFCGFCLRFRCDHECLWRAPVPRRKFTERELTGTNCPLLHCMAYSKPDFDSLACLILNGGNIHELNDHGETFLHVLDPKNLILLPDHFLQLLSLIAERGFNFETLDSNGQNALHRIIFHENWAGCPTFHDPRQPGAEAILIVKAIDLISFHQNQWFLLYSRDIAGGSLLRHLVLLAIRSSTAKEVKRLLASFIYYHCGEGLIYDEAGASILHRAVSIGRKDLVAKLLEFGADPWEENCLGMDAAVYGWGFLELYHDDRDHYADIWVSMQRVLDKQQEIRANMALHGKPRL
jgi:hypothetical protein